MRPRGVLNLPGACCAAGHTLHHVKPIQCSIWPPSKWGGAWPEPRLGSHTTICPRTSQLCGVNTTILQLQFVNTFDIYVIPHRAQ